MRPENEKILVKQHRKTYTLKTKIDNWNDKPKLVSEQKSVEEWGPTIHHLGHLA